MVVRLPQLFAACSETGFYPAATFLAIECERKEKCICCESTHIGKKGYGVVLSLVS
jgi:hypothetical protein